MTGIERVYKKLDEILELLKDIPKGTETHIHHHYHYPPQPRTYYPSWPYYSGTGYPFTTSGTNATSTNVISWNPPDNPEKNGPTSPKA